MQVEVSCCSPHHYQQQPQPTSLPLQLHLDARHRLLHLLSFPSAAVILGLLSQPRGRLSALTYLAVPFRQLSYLIAPKNQQPPWPFLIQTWNCPSVLNLILN